MFRTAIRAFVPNGASCEDQLEIGSRHQAPEGLR
jgi:hypothetical protein